MSLYQERKSYGIALIRYNQNISSYEILMIKKRHTYNFINFLFDVYDNDNNSLICLFSNMSFYEKRIILSLNYSIMWCYLWGLDTIAKDDSNFYKEFLCKKKIFDDKYNSTENINRLKNIINNTPNIDTFWEIPKGNKKNREKQINTAIREMKEETGINYGEYKILFDIDYPQTMSFFDKKNKVKYIYNYYLAIQNYNIIPSKKKLKSIEVIDIKWVKLQEIDKLNINPISKKSFIKMIKILLSEYKHLLHINKKLNQSQDYTVISNNTNKYSVIT